MARYVTLKDSNGEALYPQIKADSIADGSVTSDKIDWATSKWHTFDVTPGDSSITINENHSVYNEDLRLCLVHLSLTCSSGLKSTLVSGLPLPVSGQSMFILGTGSAGTISAWVRATGTGAGTLGSSASSTSTTINLVGMYPISTSTLPTSTGDY